MRTVLLIILMTALSANDINRNDTVSLAISGLAAKEKALYYKQRSSISCSPDLAVFDLADPANTIPLLGGWGNYQMQVTTNNDSAHIYFEQGINMYYGFHIIEALASFDKATHFDTGFAMGYWGKALAYGPNINDLGYSASPEALTALQKATGSSGNCMPVEKALIQAMQVRYSTDTTAERRSLDQDYAAVMKQVQGQFPKNVDVAALYADALMVQHPWDLYDKYGKPKKWTPEIVNTLEALLKLYPGHPGGSHYYIHAIEGSDHPEKGLAVADQLVLLMPGVAHVVHMPSHIYIRSGYYKAGIDVNEKAVKGYYDYLDKYPAVANNAPLYLMHNLHMQATCANMDGNYVEAMKLSYESKHSFDSSFMDAPGYAGIGMQYVYMTPLLTQIRFGKWYDILSSDPIPEKLVYANLLWHYGRGLAYARKHDFDKANAELDLVRAAAKNPQMQEHPDAFNPGAASAGVAEKLLQGIIAEESDELLLAIDILKEARSREDNMLYNEPKDWVHPVRQYLGSVLLKANDYKQAEQAYREDLKVNPHNGWSLNGLAVVLLKEGKIAASMAMQAEAKKAFERSDIRITGSVF